MSQGYTRQSAATIVPTARVRAAPVNAEYNQLAAAFSESSGHVHDGSSGQGGRVSHISDSTNKVYLNLTTTAIQVGFTSADAFVIEEVTTGETIVRPVTGKTLVIGTTANPVNGTVGTIVISSSMTISGLFVLSSAATATLSGSVSITTGASFTVPTPSSGNAPANKTYVDAVTSAVSASAAAAAASATEASNWASTAAVSAAAAAASAVTAANWASTAAVSAAAAAQSAIDAQGWATTAANIVNSKVSRSTASSIDGALVKWEGTTGSTVKQSTWVDTGTQLVAGNKLHMNDKDMEDVGIVSINKSANYQMAPVYTSSTALVLSANTKGVHFVKLTGNTTINIVGSYKAGLSSFAIVAKQGSSGNTITFSPASIMYNSVDLSTNNIDSHWSRNNVTPTQNIITPAGDGYTIVATTGASGSFAVTSRRTGSSSPWGFVNATLLKALGTDKVTVRCALDSYAEGAEITVDLTNFIITTAAAVSSTGELVDSGIVVLSSGWCIPWFSFVADSTAIQLNTTISLLNSSYASSYTATNESVLFGGCALYKGSTYDGFMNIGSTSTSAIEWLTGEPSYATQTTGSTTRISALVWPDLIQLSVISETA